MGQGFRAKSIDIASILKDVLRQCWLIVLFAVSVGLLANTFAKVRYVPEYTTKTTFVVNTQGTNTSVYSNITNAVETAERFQSVLNSTLFKREIAKILGQEEYTADSTVEVLPETNLMTLKVTDGSAEKAYACIRAIMENYSTISDFIVTGVVLDVIEEPTFPGSPFNSNGAGRFGKIGAMVGALIAALYVAYFSYLKDTIKNSREASSKLAARLLGSIYHERRGITRRKTKRAAMIMTNPILSFRYAESCRLTTSRIRSRMDREKARVVLVTSVAENEGKSTVAANLALALSQERRRVLLIDADFRKPSLYKIFDIDPKETTDFVNVLRTGKGLDTIIRKFPHQNLHFILNNAATGSIDDVLANGMFKTILEFARANFDYIVMDTAPMGLVPDAEGLAHFADASVLVVRQDRSYARSINDCIDTLNATNARVLGTVFNDVSSGASAVFGGYGQNLRAEERDSSGNSENEDNNVAPVPDIMYLVDDMWKGFKRFFWLIPIIVLICSAGNYYRARASYRPTYTAFTSFAVSTRTAYGYTSTYYNKAVTSQMAKTFPYILTSGTLQDVVKADLGVNSLNGSISAESFENSNVFTIRVTSAKPQDAYDILQSVINNYQAVARYIIGDTQLKIIDDSGVPTKPMNSANYRADAVRGIRMGLFVSLLLLALYAMTRHTVRGEEDLKKHLSLSYLGAVPHVKMKARSRRNETTILMDSPEAPGALGDCMRTIRTRFIREADDVEAQKVLVTSSIADEGKTTVAINLAISLSRQDIKVILIDADLRNPRVAKEIGIASSSYHYGTIDVLKGAVAPMDALVNYGKYSVRVLPGGKPMKAPGIILGSEEMERLVNLYAKQCDVVIIDTPPCGVVADASIIARLVDGAVYVVRQDYARLDSVLANIESLSDTGVHMLGYVLNDTSRGITGYGYGYGYGYGNYGNYGNYGKKSSDNRNRN